ncbi:MAG: ABC transporter ATP-binding protein [Thermoleophilia bacterium]|nr:ABC transporter ATP-binding protein [Thermoleophilia bacterium]
MGEPLLIAESLGKTYGTEIRTVALEGVSFALERGEFASIVGQSGSGKSTLLNLIGLLDTPTTGGVTLDGHDTRSLDRGGRARLRNELLGFVFQFHHLLPEFSVLENVVMPGLIGGGSAATLRERAVEVLGLLGLDGLEEKNANQLSGGQKQRVAIARALLNRPALVLADEPTGNLDTVNTAAVYDLFRTIHRELGTAFLIVTHDRAVAQQTDRILEVADGRLVQDVRDVYATPASGGAEAAAAPPEASPGDGEEATASPPEGSPIGGGEVTEPPPEASPAGEEDAAGESSAGGSAHV